MELANRHDLKALHEMFWQSPSALLVAKSTFFALVDEKGVAIRNDLEQDAMAGQNVVQIFPALSGAMKGTYVTTTGAFPGPAGPLGPDKDWIVCDTTSTSPYYGNCYVQWDDYGNGSKLQMPS